MIDYTLSKNLIDQIVNYLTLKPFREVNDLIIQIVNATKMQERQAQMPVKKPDDKKITDKKVNKPITKKSKTIG